jgi:hypothetical protein
VHSTTAAARVNGSIFAVLETEIVRLTARPATARTSISD